MVRVQIEITDAQAKTLDEIASAGGVSVPEPIQANIDHYLQGRVAANANTDSSSSVIGRYASNTSYVSRLHDHILSEIYAETCE